MTTASAPRGRPLVALALILGAWVCCRAALWDQIPFSVVGVPRTPLAEFDGKAALRSAEDSSPARVGALNSGPSLPGQALAGLRARAVPVASPLPSLVSRRPAPPAPVAARPTPLPVHIAAGHQMLWMAALANVPFLTNATLPSQVSPVADRRRRWSADGWVLLRRDGNAAFATGAAPATYGASQIGAVLRYRLSPDSARKPTAYLRATSALSGVDEKEAAIGLSARPVPSVPVIAAVELRATNQSSGTRLRPAVMAVTELAPFELPFDARAEFYAQAGYVGGRFKTAFADGQLRVDRQVMRAGKVEVRAGAGTWAGAQKGAARVDIGPTATLGVPVGDNASARLSADWRFRMTGNARPASGPALTLSAGF